MVGKLQVGGLAFCSLLFTHHARATEPEVFRWSWARGPGAESCPSAEKIAAGVRARLGRDPFFDRAERDLQATVARAGNDWRVDVSVIADDGRVIGSRQIESTGTDCSSLAEAVTLAVALTIDPQAAFATPPRPAPEPDAPKSLPEAASAAPPQPPPLPPPLPPSAAAQPTRHPDPRVDGLDRMSAAARGLFVVGLLPRGAFGVESAAAFALSSRLAASFGVGFLPEVRTARDGYGFGVASGVVGLCWLAAEGSRAHAELCGEALVGSIHVAVYAAHAFPPGERFLLASRFGLRGGLRIAGPVKLDLGALALVPLIRQRFALRGEADPVFQGKPVGLAVSVGLSVSIR